jgi:hypothetical protein
LTSGGIPVGDDLSADGEQYIWSEDTGKADEAETVPDLSSQYPAEELPDRFAEVSEQFF